MKKTFLLLLLCASTLFVTNAQESEPVFTPKGVKGIFVNFNSFEFQQGIGKDNKDITNLSLGLSGFYFIAKDFQYNAGIGYNWSKYYSIKGYSGDVLTGFKYLFGYTGLGVSYLGIGSDNFKKWESGLRLDASYDIFLSSQFFLSPTIYYEKTFGDFNINQIGFSMVIGYCF